MSSSLNLLTEHRIFDTIHRRAGGLARPGGYTQHADSHKYCPLGRCGYRPGAYEGGYTKVGYQTSRSTKITAWRKAKALANRRYLEETVYGNETKKSLGGHTVQWAGTRGIVYDKK